MNNSTSLKFTSSESRAVFAIALIYAFRMLGLFAILPIFSFAALHYTDATPGLIGLALGIYGLTQALLQIPFGLCSDRFGRKPVITIGLLLFMLGSFVAASAHSIHIVIVGRAIQGAGAVGSSLLALLADSTRVEVRTKAMAMIGMSIGGSFALAMVVGPALNAVVHLPGIFFITGLLAIEGILLLYWLIPSKTQSKANIDINTIPTQLLETLRNKDLFRLDLGIFCQHAILTSLFIVLPIILTQRLLIPANKLWEVYLPILFGSFILMLPLIYLSEKKNQLKKIFLGCIALLCITCFSLSATSHFLVSTLILLTLFFVAFNFLESSLPSLISKFAAADSKGTALGIYSSAQFLGIFFGGSMGGWIYGHFAVNGIYYFCGGLSMLWFLHAIFMTNPPKRA